MGLREETRRRYRRLQALQDGEADRSRLPRGEPRPGEGLVVLTCWAPWRHFPRHAYGPPAFRVGDAEFRQLLPGRGWLRPQQVSVRVAVPAGVVDVVALEPADPVGGAERAVVDRVRLSCRAGETLHLDFVAPNLAEPARGSFRLPGEGPGLPFLNASTALTPLLVPFALIEAWSFWDRVAGHRADQILPHLFAPGIGSVLRLALFAAAVVAVVTGVWAGLAPRGPFRAMRTPQTRAQAAATAESIARAAAVPPAD